MNKNLPYTYSLAMRLALPCAFGSVGCQLGTNPVYLNDELTPAAGKGSTATTDVNSSQGGENAQGGTTSSVGGTTSVTPIAATGTGGSIPTDPPAIYAGGSTAMGGTGAQGGGLGGNRPGNGGAGVAGQPTSQLDAACSSVESGIVVDTTLANLAEMLAGEWLVCDGGSFCSGTVGVVYRRDGTWSELTYSADGTLVPSTDALNYGTWKLEDVGVPGWPGRYEVQSVAFGASGSTKIPVIMTPDGRKMRSSPSSCIGTFVRASAVEAMAIEATGKRIGDIPVESTASSVSGTSSHMGDCVISPVEEPALYPTPAELAADAAGSWLKCSAKTSNTCDEDDGVEILSDGTFHRLYRDSDGLLYRGRGWYRGGHWRAVRVANDGLYADLQLELYADGEYGASRLFGTLSGIGLDSPWRWETGSMCSRSYVRADP